MTPEERERWRVEHDAELERRRLEKAAERQQRKAEHHVARATEGHYDAHTIAMAARFRNDDGSIGLPVAEYVRRMEERRSRMRILPPLEAQLATAPSVNPVRGKS